MIHSPSDVVSLLNDPRLGNCLLALRGYRETWLPELRIDLPESYAPKLEAIANQSEFAGSSAYFLMSDLSRDHRFSDAEKVRIFDQLCRRIAKLERQMCHAYIPAHLVTA
jgi:hypothetical protein